MAKQQAQTLRGREPMKATEYPRLNDEADTIDQHLDMRESGPLRGDEILHSHGIMQGDGDPDLRSVDEMMRNYHVDMAEENREGDEMSGDDHSLGLQGGERELKNQPHLHSGVPGDETEHQEEEFEDIEGRRTSDAL